MMTYKVMKFITNEMPIKMDNVIKTCQILGLWKT